MGSSISSKKWTKTSRPSCKTNSFVRFLEEIDDPKKPFRNYLTFNRVIRVVNNKNNLKTWIHFIKASKSTQVFLEVQFGKSFHLSWLLIYDLIGDFSKVGPYKHGIIHIEDWCLFSPIKIKINKNKKASCLSGCLKYYKSDIK